MRSFLTAILLPAAALAQVSGTCENPFQADFQAGRELRIRVRSGDIDVVGAGADRITVTCDLPKKPSAARDIAISFKPASGLRIEGGPNGDVRIRIEVPRKTHLWIRSPAGDLTVSGITGDKDVEIHAGDLKISVGDPADYRSADGSVKAGDLTASAFGVSKGGLFRSFKKDNLSGRYRLHAHVGAGDLILH